MTSSRLFVFLLAIVTFVPMSPTAAKEFKVGDDLGWTVGFNYQAWANGKVFHVGDKLVFQYPVGAHNVFKVNGTSFQSCAKPPLTEALSTGNDTIVLATSGRKWYICGVGNHCDLGQKLVITVQAPSAEAPAPSPLYAMTPPSKKAKRPFISTNWLW